jgi:hypothetical protein
MRIPSIALTITLTLAATAAAEPPAMPELSPELRQRLVELSGTELDSFLAREVDSSANPRVYFASLEDLFIVDIVSERPLLPPR